MAKSDYQFGFDPNTWKPTISSKGYNKNTYGDPSTRILRGYITGRKDSNAIDQVYQVQLPELQTEVSARTMLPPGYTNVNGIGIKPYSMEVGTPVFVQFLQESREVIIIGTENLAGLSHGEKVLETRQTPAVDEFPMWRQSFPMALTELGIDSQVNISPMDLRSSNPNYEYPVLTGNRVPGSMEIKSTKGITYSIDPTANIRYTSNNILKVEGINKDYSDKSLEALQFVLEQSGISIENSLRRNYVFVDGKINPGALAKFVNALKTVDPTGTIQGALIFLQKLEDGVQVALNFIELADSFLQWVSQDISVILEDLFDTFGKFDLDLGMVSIDLDISLHSIDLNLDFRIGTGIPIVDTLVNTVLNTVVNTLLDALLKNFSIGKFLGIAPSASPPSINTGITYKENIFTPILRSTGRLSTGRGSSVSIRDVLGKLKTSVESVLELDDSPYLNPAISLRSANINTNIPYNKLGKHLVLVSGNPNLFYLPYYLNNFYTYLTEEDLIAAITLTATNTEDKIKLLFLYGYYSLEPTKVKDLAELIFPEYRANKLLNKHNWSTVNTYLELDEYLVSNLNVYNPLELNLTSLANTINDNLVRDAIEYIEAGQITHFINQAVIITSKKDLRMDLLQYVHLKELVNYCYPTITIGFEHE